VQTRRAHIGGHIGSARRWAKLCIGIVALTATAALADVVAADTVTGNLISNPSFTVDSAGWDGEGAKVKRVKVQGAPDGSHVAKVRRAAAGTSYSLDDSPDAVSGGSAAGQVFVARAWVRGTKASAGQELRIAVTETTPSGESVSSSEAAATLSGEFVELEVAHTATSDGNSIGVRLYRPQGTVKRKKDQFLTDAISLMSDVAQGTDAPGAPDPPSGYAPPDDPPGEDPPHDDPPDDEPPSDEPPPSPDNAPVTTSQLAITYPHEEQLVEEEGSRYRYAVMRDVQYESVAGFEEANPDTDLLVYKNAAFTVHDPQCNYDPYQASGVSHCDANSHESWFLHDKGTGERLMSSGYSYLYAMDVGDPGYRQAWLESVLERLRDADGSGARYGGVFIDDVNLHPIHWSSGQLQEMTDTQYRQAMQSFIAYVSPRLQQEGFFVMTNLAFDTGNSSQKTAAIDIANRVDAVNREYYVRWGSGSPLFSGNDWMHHLTLTEDLMATGADYNGIAYGTAGDVQAQRYARATFLLAWDGKDGSSMMYRPDESSDPYLPDWTTDVGVPLGPRTQVGVGWKREFSDGVVIINPSSSGSQSFHLGAGYRKPDGSCASSVTLAPTRALVLPAC
jgi:Hypothetical glycosyl hydrolase family 15